MTGERKFAASLRRLAIAGARAAVVAATAGFAAVAAAQPAPPPTSGTTITVTGRGLGDSPAVPAYDVETLGPAQLHDAVSDRIEDALADVAGFQSFRRSDSRASNPSAQGVTLRALGGNAASRTMVLLDGVPMVDPFFGYVPLSAIDPQTLASARITRGGGSGAFGAGAVAGEIALDSAAPREIGRLSGEALIDDRAESELSGTFAPQLGQGFAEVSGRWDRGEGFWTTPPDQRVPASVRAAYDSWSTGLRGVAPLSDDIELQARTLIFDDQRVLRFAGANSQSLGEDASLRLVGRGSLAFDALFYVQARDFNNIVVSARTFRPVLDEYSTPSTGLGGKLELRPRLGADNLVKIGSDWRLGIGQSDEATLNPVTGAVTGRRRSGGRNGDTGLFAEDDWTLGALVLTGGVRADRWTIADGFLASATPAGVTTSDNLYPNRAGWEGSYRAGAVLTAATGLKLRAAAYSQLRVPTLNELYRPFTLTSSAPGQSVVVITNANAALANELLHGIEAGFDFDPAPNVTLSVTGFIDKLDHAIDNRTLSTRTSAPDAAGIVTVTTIRMRANLGAIRARGLEFEAHGGFGTFALDGSLALTDARVEASGDNAVLNGLRPAQTPSIAASLSLGWHPAPGYDAALVVRHVGAQFEDDLNSSVLPAATTLGSYAELPLKGPFSLVLRAENLTNVEVETRNQAGSIDLGTPRTLWVGVKLRTK
ncbi:MAG: TonB-dependent receptor [Sphingomonadales bacterium]|nr:TonB-dependent receptor [Sphingomonadales bacterium]